MFDTTESQTRLTKLAWGTAFATLVIGQLHALARHRTEDGKSDLDLAATVVLGRARGPGPRPAAQLGRPRHRLPGLRQVVDARARRHGRGRLHGDAAPRAVRRRALGLEDHRWSATPCSPSVPAPSTGASGRPTTSWRTSGSGWISPERCWPPSARTVLGIALLRRGARPTAGRGAPAPDHPGPVRDQHGDLARQHRPAGHVRHRDARQRRDPEGRDRARRAVDPGGPGDTMSG